MIIRRRVRLIEQAYAGLDEQPGLGFEIQWRKFLDRAADGAVGTGDDIISHISVVQNIGGCALKPWPVKVLAVQGQAGDYAGLIEARAVIETPCSIDPRHLGGDLAIGKGDDRRAGEQLAHWLTASRWRLRRLGLGDADMDGSKCDRSS